MSRTIEPRSLRAPAACRIAAAVATLCGVTLSGAAPAAAQLQVRLAPQLSWLAPAGPYEALLRTPGNDLNIDLPDFALVGGMLGVSRAGLPFELRVTGFTTTERREVDAVVVCGDTGACTADGDLLGGMAISGVIGDLLLTPLPRAALRPYLLAGAGAARYSFHWPPSDPDELALRIGPLDRTTTITRAGGGIDFALGWLTANVEAADLMTWLDGPGHVEHALALTLGLGLRTR